MGTIWLVLNDFKFLGSPKAEGYKGKEGQVSYRG